MSISTIDSKTLKTWLENNQAVLIDVREIFENEAESIDGAELISLGQIDIDVLPKTNPNQKLVIHCRSGKRSLNACQKLIEQNPELEVYNLEGGIEGWKAEGFAIKSSTDNSSKDKMLPNSLKIEAAALSVFVVGIILGFTSKAAFLWLSALAAIYLKIIKTGFKCPASDLLKKEGKCCFSSLLQKFCKSKNPLNPKS